MNAGIDPIAIMCEHAQTLESLFAHSLRSWGTDLTAYCLSFELFERFLTVSKVEGASLNNLSAN